MKRFGTFLLALVMVLSLCACGGSGEEGKPAEGLQVGFSKVNVTPDIPVGLGGYSNSETRKSEGLMDYVYITCIAASEGDETVLLYTVDICGFREDRWDMFRKAISPETGIPEDRIFIACTHCHSAPEINNQADGMKVRELYVNGAIEAAKKALEDRAPATVETASEKIEGMNFVRHYKMLDGSYAGSNFGDYNIGIVDHAAEADNELVLVKFNRGEEKKPVVMVNWQAHPDFSNSLGFTMISSDFIGPLRDELEKLSGAQVAYFTAASGNLNAVSKIESEMHNLTYKEYGIKMGQFANDVLAKCQPLEGSGVAATTNDFQVEIDHSWDHMLSAANEIYELWKSTDNANGEAKTLGKEKYNFTSVYQARAIRSRAAMGTHETRETCAIRIGGLGIISASYEMFCQNGQYIKENSPFKTTFIMTSNSGYIPVPEAYDYRSYEADTGFYAKGTAEKLADEYVRLLNTLK